MPKFSNQYCIHCLGYFKELTEDHIFPVSWYPDSTPENLEKWTAPSCEECNQKLGKIESEICLRVGPATNPSDSAASGIAESTMRRIKPDLARDSRSKGRKIAELKKLFKEFVVTTNLPPAIMKNFGPSNKSTRYHILFLPYDKLLDPFAEKIIRGLEYKLYNRFVTRDKIIRPVYLPDSTHFNEIEQLKEIIKQNGKETNRGPGFIIEHAHDKHGTFLYHITIWGKFKFWADVTSKHLEGGSNQI
ncbi:MAG: hypothetical protein A3G49_04420 [Candidatus Sungbacteria bacterium RIFCSPLOWO2_12_FULL_41_11]|uniref:HNH endonuclease 5 domain-containing protein n=1 Tax=Candidatus Sungbacteria bacterium RIFCSPLOWO2_12_FULL_41_11 TaxID=1802286 RepID=A0A1G2LMQ5_9BACT|nr:MAG: hypothetical protein A3D41_01390 [Candidatus Sungbacteria bacterium RIFCSPHIGHO2_02_FULL_41_12b]OHA12920.1 MAG: hypothetical protein A3G49_04420 [Candidatus Sungbacteria bacterium RIFCSPLOWO2_12_FULL_41_11]